MSLRVIWKTWLSHFNKRKAAIWRWSKNLAMTISSVIEDASKVTLNLSTMMSAESPSRMPGRSASSSPGRKAQAKSPKKTSSLAAEVVDYLKEWMMSPEHIAHPYPTEQEKNEIMADTGIEIKQLTNWFVNNRKRFWKPRVEAKLQQQARAKQAAMASSARPRVVSPSNQNKNAETALPVRSASRAPYLALDMTQPANTALPKNMSFVSCDTLAEFAVAGKARAVSVATSSDTESDDSSLSSDAVEPINSDELDTVNGIVKRTETIDVSVLRPTNPDQIPTMEDMSTLANIPSSRIIKTYKNCTLSFQFPLECEAEKKKIQNRRDAEVVRIKKHYLKKFLEERAEVGDAVSHPSRKRARSDKTESVVLHRPKYQRRCLKVWKEACRTANHSYDAELPSLDEAAKLFGYEG